MSLYHKLTYHVLKSFGKILRSLTSKNRHIISQNIASILYNFIPKRKETAINNIRIAFPSKSSIEVNQILKNCYQFFSYNFIQFMAFPPKYDSLQIKVDGRKILNDALKNDKGVILISAHFGAWEVLGHWFGVNDYPLRGVAQKQKNRGANKFFEEKRKLSGISQVYRKTDIEILYEVLHQKEILGLVSDQDAKQKGVFVDFFNKPASTHKGAALFHQKTNAPMIFGVCLQNQFNEYKIKITAIESKKNTVKTITQNYTSALETLIKKYPEQYFWFHKRWKTKEPN
ncbi:MAG: lysophospholipid acyltransferase family protein [Candidatus Neomarinimicrobiota bacterium]